MEAIMMVHMCHVVVHLCFPYLRPFLYPIPAASIPVSYLLVISSDYLVFLDLGISNIEGELCLLGELKGGLGMSSI